MTHLGNKSMDYIIAIPSHMRIDTIQKRTLALIERNGISKSCIKIFVSPVCYKNYKDVLGSQYRVIRSYASILNTRNHIIRSHKDGQRIVEIDDDIEEIITFPSKRPVESLESLITSAFEKSSGGLWGISATTDPRNACKTKEGFGLRSIVNSFLGYTNQREVRLTMKEKEYFERTIIFWKKGLPIYKMPQFGVKTKYWKNKGGIQAHYDETKRRAVQMKAADELYSMYPDLVYKKKRPNGIVDIRFRRSFTVNASEPSHLIHCDAGQGPVLGGL
jgi:hypothetical protein